MKSASNVGFFTQEHPRCHTITRAVRLPIESYLDTEWAQSFETDVFFKCLNESVANGLSKTGMSVKIGQAVPKL